MTKELKCAGKRYISHHPPLTDEDLQKTYKYFTECANTNAVVLQHKVSI